jgi:hypothetical protein
MWSENSDVCSSKHRCLQFITVTSPLTDAMKKMALGMSCLLNMPSCIDVFLNSALYFSQRCTVKPNSVCGRGQLIFPSSQVKSPAILTTFRSSSAIFLRSSMIARWSLNRLIMALSDMSEGIRNATARIPQHTRKKSVNFLFLVIFFQPTSRPVTRRRFIANGSTGLVENPFLFFHFQGLTPHFPLSRADPSFS